jgi:hypothetical protein
MWQHQRRNLHMAYQQSLISYCELEEDLYVALAAEGHALLKKLLYAPKLVPELLGVASACKRLPEVVQIGARASVVFRSLGTRPANPLRKAILQFAFAPELPHWRAPKPCLPPCCCPDMNSHLT